MHVTPVTSDENDCPFAVLDGGGGFPYTIILRTPMEKFSGSSHVTPSFSFA